MKLHRRDHNTALEEMRRRRRSNESTDTKGAVVLYATDSAQAQNMDKGTERNIDSAGIDNVQEFVIDNHTENDTNGGDTDLIAHTQNSSVSGFGFSLNKLKS